MGLAESTPNGPAPVTVHWASSVMPVPSMSAHRSRCASSHCVAGRAGVHRSASGCGVRCLSASGAPGRLVDTLGYESFEHHSVRCSPDPKSAHLPGPWLLTHSQPSHPVPGRVGQCREQTVSIQDLWADGRQPSAARLIQACGVETPSCGSCPLATKAPTHRFLRCRLVRCTGRQAAMDQAPAASGMP
jgi:hypothetical protein